MVMGVYAGLRAQEAQPSSPQEPPPPPEVSWAEPRAVVEGEELPVAIAITPTGPLFSLPPIVARMGGALVPGPYGESYTLRVLGTEFLFGPDSPALTVGREILPLSQPPRLGEHGLQVPLDFLQRTLGDLLGYEFTWEPGLRQLRVARQEPRHLPVTVDVVHLQGMTTVVLQFPEAPRHRVVERPGRVEVEMIADRIEPPAEPPRVEDPLVRRIEIHPERVRLHLVSGAAAESYLLKDPFRLVFDIHRQAATPPPAVTEIRRPEQAAGIRTIVLDPGHGGSETGAVGKSGVAEKDLTLLLAQALKSRLESRLPVKVLLTRSEDAHLPLETRTAIANQAKADLFISLHLNASTGPEARGAETYFLNLQASDPQAARSAALENVSAATGEDGAGSGDPLYDLQLILWDLAQSHHLTESQALANLVQEELNETLGLKDRGVKQAPFRVLMGAAMPAVLLELGFLSNPDEEARLQDPSYRAGLVDALVRAISRYKAQAEGRPGQLGEATP